MKSNLNEERRKAAPDARDLKNAKEVWKNGETAPSGDTQPALGVGRLVVSPMPATLERERHRSTALKSRADVVGTYSKGGEKPRKKP